MKVKFTIILIILSICQLTAQDRQIWDRLLAEERHCLAELPSVE